MPSLSASIFGFATGIAIADKIDVVTSTHAAILMKSRRRIGRPSFWLSAVCGTRRMLCEPDCSQECYCRLDRRGSASAFRERLSERSREQIATLLRRPWPLGSGSRTATCVLGADGDKRREAALCEPCVHLILMGAIHIRDTNGRSPPPRPNGRELPKAE